MASLPFFVRLVGFQKMVPGDTAQRTPVGGFRQDDAFPVDLYFKRVPLANSAVAEAFEWKSGLWRDVRNCMSSSYHL